MKTYDADVPVDINDDVGNDLMSDLKKVPTTNDGELSEVIDEENKYGGKFGNIGIYGHLILNQCGTLLTRKKYHIKVSSIHNFLLRFCVTIRGFSITLMYS